MAEPTPPSHELLNPVDIAALSAIDSVGVINRTAADAQGKFGMDFFASEVDEDLEDGTQGISPNDEVLMAWEMQAATINTPLEQVGISAHGPIQTNRIAAQANFNKKRYTLYTIEPAWLDLIDGNLATAFFQRVESSGNAAQQQASRKVLSDWINRAYEEIADDRVSPSTEELLAYASGMRNIYTQVDGTTEAPATISRLSALREATDNGYGLEFAQLDQSGVFEPIEPQDGSTQTDSYLVANPLVPQSRAALGEQLANTNGSLDSQQSLLDQCIRNAMLVMDRNSDAGRYFLQAITRHAQAAVVAIKTQPGMQDPTATEYLEHLSGTVELVTSLLKTEQ